MTRYIPYDKLSKKEKRKLDSSKRNTWGNINPITRKPDNSRAYNRRKQSRIIGMYIDRDPNNEEERG